MLGTAVENRDPARNKSRLKPSFCGIGEGSNHNVYANYHSMFSATEKNELGKGGQGVLFG